MSLILPQCIEYNEKRRVCIAEEKGKKYQLNNISNTTIKKIKIDNCLQQNAGEKRCDFLMEIGEHSRVIFIELKGADLSSAIKQIYATILYLRNEFDGHRLDARIIGSKDVPGFINTPGYKSLAKQIKPTSGTIERSTNKLLIENI